MTMLRTLLLLLVLLLATLAGAQSAPRPKPGEAVLRLEIEGRGNVFIVLNTVAAPKTTAQIIRLVKQGFYDGQRFHRVERSPRPYLVQVGDPASRSNLDAAATGGSGSTLPVESSGLNHVAGAVGLARNPDDPNSGDSQFYMLLSPARFLDGKYTVFGQVTPESMPVLNRIERGDRILTARIL